MSTIPASQEQRILILDDDAALLAGIRRQLGRTFVLDTVQRVDQALQMLARQPPYALVVADLHMPGTDGVAFLVEAKKRSPQTIRMMLTGHASLETALRAVNDGNVFRFIAKPCPAGELHKFVEAGLRQHELQQAERRAEVLEELNKAKDDVLTTVSHELRTPVTILRLMAETLGEEARTGSDTLAEMLGDMVVQTKKLSGMIDQTLDLLQLNTGSAHVSYEPVDLVTILREIAESCQNGRRKVALQPGVDQAMCKADAARIRQAVEQLIDNAAKFAGMDKEITIGIRSVAEGHEVSVSDLGPGVDPRVRARLFEPFFQKEEVLVDKPPGLGLGLAIVKRILDLHGASISCSNGPRGGAAFTVVLPASQSMGP